MDSAFESRPYFWRQGYIAYLDPRNAVTPHPIDIVGKAQFRKGFEAAKNDLLSDGDES